MLKKALLSIQPLSACVLTAALASLAVVQTGFALECRLHRSSMAALLLLNHQRRDACLALKWRWEADDQEHQYKAGSSAGSQSTVGPIEGFVMDVTENESGHAQGDCHPAHTSYRDLAAGF